MINVLSLIGFFLSNEDKLKQIFKISDYSKIKNKKIKKMIIKKMKMWENQAISRLTSSYFGPVHSSVDKFVHAKLDSFA